MQQQLIIIKKRQKSSGSPFENRAEGGGEQLFSGRGSFQHQIRVCVAVYARIALRWVSASIKSPVPLGAAESLVPGAAAGVGTRILRAGGARLAQHPASLRKFASASSDFCCRLNILLGAEIVLQSPGFAPEKKKKKHSSSPQKIKKPQK